MRSLLGSLVRSVEPSSVEFTREVGVTVVFPFPEQIAEIFARLFPVRDME